MAKCSSASRAGPRRCVEGLRRRLRGETRACRDSRCVRPTAVKFAPITLENGQIWETREADWTLEFKSSDTVTISRMVFGSYQVSLPGKGRSVGVKRIQ